jgi:hypothetical protein
MRQVLLLLPVIFTILTSGCTMPSDFCIPGFTCGQTVEETDDVIVIESLQALPDNIPPGGQLKVIAIISNVADIDAEIRQVPVTMELYDYCSGLFEEPTPSIKQGIGELQRGEKKQVEWTLKARDRASVPVKTECDFKIRAKYPYATKSLTTLHFIDYAEMQRKINDGTYSEVGSYTSVGHGPIKPYITVEGTQPIAVTNDEVSLTLSFQIKNTGGGFLSTEGDEGCKIQRSSGTTGGTAITEDIGPVIRYDQVSIQTVSGQSELQQIGSNFLGKLEQFFKEDCSPGGPSAKLIRKETTPMPVTLETFKFTNNPLESTATILSSVGEVDTDGKPTNAYWYEFRDEVKVTVEPRF